ncbi:golgi-localized GRIP domain-containing protein [Actinidia rufa]|uniref:Golgi-localized GRIP domain-containing protein n=1 Tax=Actinidia rufa TaxID=165716 RepID=A0A7J0GF94_9ERIC|nr:golgi-localized GRIP domain-containing protein [Actinidia rufa]
MLENHAEDGVKPDDQLIDTNHGSGENLGKENGLHGHPYTSDSNLVQMVVELNFQNEYLKSQFEDLRNLHSESSGSSQQKVAIEQDGGGFEDVKELRAKIESLSRELSEEKQTRGAAEEALKHLRAVYSEADVKAQELSTKLAEAQQKMDQEIKERDEKYSELDSKFNRLHKRAKQRIQEVQKEKDDLEAQFRDLKEKADHALSQQSALQQDLERTRQQANDALKAMDADRQQLRSANNKLRDNIEELRRSLEPKENALEALQQSLLEKEQMLEDMQGLLQAADDKRQAAIAELSAKHQKQIESLEAQLSDELADRSKATETISALQGVIAEKESKIAEMDAASSGEVARFRAAMETVKGELIHLKHEHDPLSVSQQILVVNHDVLDVGTEKEKKSWEATTQALKTKLDFAESSCVHAEIEAAKTRSQLELELSVRGQLISTRDAELKAAKEEINRLETEFSSYKARAHTLLQKKDAELAAARDNELLKEHEEALKEAEKEVQLISAERDRALQDLQDALANHINEIGARDEALSSAEQQIKSMQIKLNSADARYLSEKEAWEISLQNLEETWRLRCEALKAQKEASPSPDLQKELEDLKLLYKKLKEEHDSFRDLADKLIEEKDKEISRLIDDNKNLHKSQELRPLHEQTYSYTAAFRKQDPAYSSTSATEQQILTLARQQAQREEELAQSQRHILALQEEIEELERENRLHSQQEAMLKEEFRNMERSKKREGVDMTYLKNVILKLLQTGEVEALLPVVAMLLQFSPDEMQKCYQAYRSSTDVPPSPASDTSGSGFSLFPRFSFS